jgi:hypothetical protein
MKDKNKKNKKGGGGKGDIESKSVETRVPMETYIHFLGTATKNKQTISAYLCDVLIKVQQNDIEDIEEDKKNDIEDIEEDKKNDIEEFTKMYRELKINEMPEISNHTKMTTEEFTIIFQEITTSLITKCMQNEELFDMNKMMFLAIKEFNSIYGESQYKFTSTTNKC